MTTVFIVFDPLDGQRRWEWPEDALPPSAEWIGAGGWPDPEMSRETQWLISDASEVDAFLGWAQTALKALMADGFIGPKCRVILNE